MPGPDSRWPGWLNVLVLSVVVAVYSRVFTGDHSELTDTVFTQMTKGLGVRAVPSIVNEIVVRVSKFGFPSVSIIDYLNFCLPECYS